MKEKTPPRQRIRVLHVLPDGRVTGAQLYALELCAALPRERYYAEVCFLRTGPLVRVAEQMGLRVSAAGWGKPNDWRAAARFGGFLQDGAFDILHAHHTRRRVRLLAQRCGVRHVVHHLHALPNASQVPYRRGGLDKWLSAAFAGCDYCIVDSELLRDRALKARPGAAEKMLFIRPGLDRQPWENPLPVEKAKAALGLPSDALVVGTAARMVPVKRLDLFVDLAASVRAVCPRAVFVICGDGPSRLDLRARAEAMGVGDGIRFIGWQRNIQEAMASFDVFATTCVDDVFARTALEAMAMSRPVVAFRAGCITEWVEDGVTGLLAPTGDVEAMRDAVVSLIEDETLRLKLGAQAGEWSRERFDLASPAVTIQRLYEKLFVLEAHRKKSAANRI